MSRIFKTLGFFTVMFLSVAGCRKQEEKVYQFSGSLTMGKNIPLKGAEIELTLYAQGYPAQGPRSKLLASGYTDSSGRFTLEYERVTGYFRKLWLYYTIESKSCSGTIEAFGDTIFLNTNVYREYTCEPVD